jgi:5-enolpyruvylshikimate-3-phosphate synthase
MGELRVKESDRFLGSMKLAQAIGCETWAEGDDFYIRGLGSADHFSAFTLDAGLDHRIVMSAAVAATAGNGGTIVNWKTVESSYPAFFEDLISIQ